MQNLWGSRLKVPGYIAKSMDMTHQKHLGSFEFRTVRKILKIFQKST